MDWSKTSTDICADVLKNKINKIFFAKDISYCNELQTKCSDDTVNKNEPRYDKINKVSVRPAKTQISLGIRLGLIRVFAVRMKKAWVLSWADAQADLSLRQAQSLCMFCHVVAQMVSYSMFSLYLKIDQL